MRAPGAMPRKPGGSRVAAGDDPGQVRSVSERIEVRELGILRLERQVGPMENGAEPVNGHDARVDERDVDAGTRQAVRPEVVDADPISDLGERVRRARVGRALRARKRDARVRRDGDDERRALEDGERDAGMRAAKPSMIGKAAHEVAAEPVDERLCFLSVRGADDHLDEPRGGGSEIGDGRGGRAGRNEDGEDAGEDRQEEEGQEPVSAAGRPVRSHRRAVSPMPPWLRVAASARSSSPKRCIRKPPYG